MSIQTANRIHVPRSSCIMR